jgi:hypothetical protein
MSEPLSVLIIGGYGTFGRRIVALLEHRPGLTLLVGGRSPAKARAFCAGRVAAKATLVPVAFDRNGDLGALLGMLGPNLVIDASGPFQSYGKAPYRVIEACLVRGIAYLDLADSAEFVAGVAAYDAAAKAKGVYVLSGVSSFPVLTAAAVRRLAEGMAHVDEIHAGVAPSPYAGVGENVVRAIAAQAGKPAPMRRDGQPATGHPITETLRATIAPPGGLPLQNRLFSLVNVPDLLALAEPWPDVRTIWVGAGPAPELLHRVLIGLATLVRWRVLPTLRPLASLMHLCTRKLRWGERRGGMFVAVEGRTEAGAPVHRSWHMTADGDDGPYVPAMAAAALVAQAQDGRPPAPGARPCLSDLELSDYEALFAGKAIRTGIRDDTASRMAPLYRRLLGSAYDQLPAELQTMHDLQGDLTVSGQASVERGRSPLAWLIALVVGFPPPSPDVPITVHFHVADRVETWTRRFGQTSFLSRQFAGTGRNEHLLCEQFGPLTFAMAVVAEAGRLELLLRRWSAFGVPLPLWLAPRSEAFETAEDGRFRFHVEISHPLTGLIVRYRGWLAPD